MKHPFFFRLLILLLVALTASACTRMQTIEMSPAELAAAVRDGELLKPGDRMEIATLDEQIYEIEFVTITDDMIVGASGERIPVEEIAALRTPEFSMGRTALLGSAILASVWVYAIATFSVASIL